MARGCCKGPYGIIGCLVEARTLWMDGCEKRCTCLALGAQAWREANMLANRGSIDQTQISGTPEVPRGPQFYEASLDCNSHRRTDYSTQ